MSALGSSVINKSGKKFAPKAPLRRPAASTSAQTSARASVDRQPLSQTPQPQNEQQQAAASPGSPISHPTPAPPSQPIAATQTPTSQDNASTLISIPTTRQSQPTNPIATALKPLIDTSLRKRSAGTPQITSIQESVDGTSAIDNTQAIARSGDVAASTAVTLESSSIPIEHPSEPPAITPTSVAGGVPSNTVLPTTEALQDNANPPAAKRRRIEKSQGKDSTIQVTTPHVSSNLLPPSAGTRTTASGPPGIFRREPIPTPPITQLSKTKKPRAPARPKGKKRADNSAATNEAGATQVISAPASANSQSPKAKRPRKSATGKGRQQTAEDVAAEIVTDAVLGTIGRKKGTRGRRKRSPTPEGAANETITPTETKMSELCKDLRKGQKSRMAQTLQEMDEAEYAKTKGKELQSSVDAEELEHTEPQETDDQRIQGVTNERSTHRGPQLVIVDGEITYEQSSLTIDRHADAAIERNAEQLESVEENDLTRHVTSFTHMKVDRSGSWNEELTYKFYEGLRMFGTDFEMISKLFPGRSRRSIKLKFCKEEKSDYQRIKEALTGERIPVDIDEFSRVSNTVYGDPKELEREMEKDRKELEEAMAKEKEQLAEESAKRAEEARLEGEAVGGDEEVAVERRKGKKGKGERRKKGKKGKVLDGGGEVELGPIEL